MYTYATRTSEAQHSTVPNDSCKAQTNPSAEAVIADHRPETAVQRKIAETIAASPRTTELGTFQLMADRYTQLLQKKENRTGLPDNLKSGIEHLSGYSLDDVKVHYGSAKPAEIQAHAYAQGTDIHLAPGQEKHLPHEAWHIVQQKQGRVKPTMQLREKVAVNDDKSLENEADHMGAKALQLKAGISASETKQAVSASPVIQRFTILNPGQYQTLGNNPGQLFPSNQLITGRTQTTDNSGMNSYTETLKWEQRQAVNPSLKVSENGLLALENTVGQPRVFYGDPEKIASFRQRLINIRSRITLEMESGHQLSVPKTPHNPGQETNTLRRVKPVLSPHMNQNDPLMDANICTNVSEKIVNGKIISVGNDHDGEKLVDKVQVMFGNAIGLGKTVNALTPDSTLEDFAVERRKNSRFANLVYDSTIPIKPEVRDYFNETSFFRKPTMPSEQILRALSIDGIPEELLKQVYELFLKKEEDEDKILSYIGEYLQIRETLDYNRNKRNTELVDKFGINEMASPEVGESFSTFAQTSPKVVDKYGVLTHELDTSKMSNKEMRKVVKEFLALRNRVGQLKQLAGAHYTKNKDIIPFAEHHAAVVAKDGPDTITFENYNRQVESDTLQEKIWDEWFGNMDGLTVRITQKLDEMFTNVREPRKQDRDAVDKYMRVLAAKRENLLELQQGFVRLTKDKRLKIDTNFLTNENDLWHFNMYGPGRQTFINEHGKQQPQSFHEVWSESIPNAITLRTTGMVDEPMGKAVQDKLPALAYQLIKANKFSDPVYIYHDFVAHVLNHLNPQTKRITLSDLMVWLDKLEMSGPDLDEEELREAEMLYTKNKPEIRKKITESLQQSNTAFSRIEYNRNMALKLLRDHDREKRQLGLKYARWTSENLEESTVMKNKAKFFREFYEAV